MSDQKNNPVLDEQTFGKLLEAAFVLQEHNRKMRELEENLESQSEKLREQELASQTPYPASESETDEAEHEDQDYTRTLAEIVEAQHQIQIRHLELDKALAVVAERVARITNASGAGIGILDDAVVRYRAGAGGPALPVGTEVPLQTAVCQASVRTGQVIRTEDLDTEFLFDPEPCRKRGIRSLLAVPIYYDGDIAGALELYFGRIRGFAEEDIHTCQLMAGLVTEALGRELGGNLRKPKAPERSTMLAAIEGFQPSPEALAEDSSAVGTISNMVAAGTSSCWRCGDRMLAPEQFCGTCGAARASDGDVSTMQSKLASALHTQQTNEKLFPAAPANGSSTHTDFEKHALFAHRPAEFGASDAVDSDKSFSLAWPNPEQQTTQSVRPRAASEHHTELTESLTPASGGPAVDAGSNALATSPGDVAWNSATKAQDFLESLAAIRKPSALARFWRSRRGDFYLAVAVVLVVIVIGWGVLSEHSVGAAEGGAAVSKSVSRNKRATPDADLSAFDNLLIYLGLAEPPETPQYKGNPDTQVWLDLNTALYYCPGSDLYEKTARGKLASQREAQLDQFEPASRRPCD